jgi:glycerol-3-phosphate O-acyltransferase
MRAQDQERIQVEVVSRALEDAMQAARREEGYLELLVNDTLYHERRRLEGEDGPEARSQLAYYDQIQRRAQHASEQDLRAVIEELGRRFTSEIVGNFDARVYDLVTQIVPRGLWLLLNAMSPRLLLEGEAKRSLAEHLTVTGEVEHARRLLSRGTLIVVPTHSSNLDSIVIGYVAYLIGLPPLTYGAGLNLFTNPILSYFMRNVGAYRVDRRKVATLYKQLLKEYATCSLEMGYHNLFFPGGTRSRSGAIEEHLKLGLLGSGLRAYVNNLKASRGKPNIYIVPCTISYKLVLEAETLIADYLKETGRSRYIIADDEFSKPRRLLNFARHLWSLDSRIVIRFSNPLDVFGNRVDLDGTSVDARGRSVDTRRYVTQAGEVQHDAQRDAQYTRELADEVCRAFRRDSYIMSTHLVAHALFALLERANPGMDLYRLLHTGGHVSSFPMDQLHAEVERTLEALRASGDGPRLGNVVAKGDVLDIVGDALKHFGIYHTRAAAERRGDRVFPVERKLLLYYGNRLRGYHMETALAA